MNKHSFVRLEFDHLLSIISSYAQTLRGRECVLSLAPLDQPYIVRRSLRAVFECLDLKRHSLLWSFSELPDPSKSLSLLRIEASTLDARSILDIARLCEQALAARSSIAHDEKICPVLFSIVKDVPESLHRIVQLINKHILPSGELDERASHELAQIRREINRLRTQLTRSLESLMHRNEDAIQDQLVTIRNDRFVIPVKAGFKGNISGVTHGSSSSGATLFVEPLESIESNNELLALREAEEREIVRILFELTRKLAAEVSSIEKASTAIEELDVIRAKALFTDIFKCVEPEIREEGVLKLIDARHPILEKQLRESGTDEKIVPISLSITKEEPVLVISGANAGGKTVVLKTVGLLSLMALSGIGCPAKEATLPFYGLVVADIGDNQSLSANLSTFTSHISNIRTMIDLCAEASAQRGLSLVLLDEVGTGTDPDEGSALGVAIVDYFRRTLHTHTLASTHYRGLKIYAAQEENVTSASVEFDAKTLRPTYRLLIGMEGASSGLEIAQRFGLPLKIIDAAASRISTAAMDVTRYIVQISREAGVATELRKALEEERRAVAEKYATLEREMEKRESGRRAEFEIKLKEITAQYEAQVAQILSRIESGAARAKLEREAERRTAELRRAQQRAVRDQTASPQDGQTRIARVVRNGQILDPQGKENRPSSVVPAEKMPQEITVGDRVWLRSYNTVGVVERLNNDEAEIRAGALLIKEKQDRLELAPKGISAQRSVINKQRSVAEDEINELNIIGQTVDEAVDTLDSFLDRSYLNGIYHLRIIHGVGTGALKRAIANHLKDHPHVEEFHLAAIDKRGSGDKGGAGVTLVELKR